MAVSAKQKGTKNSDKKPKVHVVAINSIKGQLISKCPFGVIVWTKIPTEKFDNFCPRM